MQIIKYQKGKKNEYLLETTKGEYILFDDIIVKYELLLKKEIADKEWEEILKANRDLQAYYVALKALEKKMYCEKEITNILQKKNFTKDNIKNTIDKLQQDGYLNHQLYIEAYIHDMLNLKVMGENKIKQNLLDLGFKEEEIVSYLEKVDQECYLQKIESYLQKKVKANKKSALEFKRNMLKDLENKGFNKEDINISLSKLDIKDNQEEMQKIILKLKNKYSKKYDEYTTKLKIKNYLYQKGYTNIHIEDFGD